MVKGLAGAGVLFRRPGTPDGTWERETELRPLELPIQGHFVGAVALQSERVVFATDWGGMEVVQSFTSTNAVWQRDPVCGLNDTVNGLDQVALVSVRTNQMVVGLPGGIQGSWIGRVALASFAFVDGAWRPSTSFSPGREAEPNMEFGAALAYSDGTLLVGAPGDELSPRAPIGSAFVLEIQNSRFLQRTNLTRPSLPAQARFGAAVAVDRDLAVIATGDPEFDPGGPGILERNRVDSV